ncbi:MAG: hypothetical protein AB7V43_10895 [Acidimicrobiia bacterium]
MSGPAGSAQQLIVQVCEPIVIGTHSATASAGAGCDTIEVPGAT